MNRRSFLGTLLALPLLSIRIEAKPTPVSKKTSFELAKETMEWGTYGKGGFDHCKGTCPEHQLRWVLLKDCSTEHLQAIMSGKWRVPYDYQLVITGILEDRGAL